MRRHQTRHKICPKMPSLWKIEVLLSLGYLLRTVWASQTFPTKIAHCHRLLLSRAQVISWPKTSSIPFPGSTPVRHTRLSTSKPKSGSIHNFHAYIPTNDRGNTGRWLLVTFLTSFLIAPGRKHVAFFWAATSLDTLADRRWIEAWHGHLLYPLSETLKFSLTAISSSMLHYSPAYWHIDDEDLGPFCLSGKLTYLPISLVFLSNGMSSIYLSRPLPKCGPWIPAVWFLDVSNTSYRVSKTSTRYECISPAGKSSIFAIFAEGTWEWQHSDACVCSLGTLSCSVSVT